MTATAAQPSYAADFCGEINVCCEQSFHNGNVKAYPERAFSFLVNIFLSEMMDNRAIEISLIYKTSRGAGTAAGGNINFSSEIFSCLELMGRITLQSVHHH